jgi:hypothetical protein
LGVSTQATLFGLDQSKAPGPPGDVAGDERARRCGREASQAMIDITLSELAVEAFLPADAERAALPRG